MCARSPAVACQNLLNEHEHILAYSMCCLAHFGSVSCRPSLSLSLALCLIGCPICMSAWQSAFFLFSLAVQCWDCRLAISRWTCSPFTCHSLVRLDSVHLHVHLTLSDSGCSLQLLTLSNLLCMLMKYSLPYPAWGRVQCVHFKVCPLLPFTKLTFPGPSPFGDDGLNFGVVSIIDVH